MALPRFSPRQLDAFIAAAERANFTYAARHLNLTPSAVSNLISELEQVLGFPVFERTTRKVALTSDGRAFLPSALAVQRQMSLAAAAAADLRNRSVEVVRVAAPMMVAFSLLPRIIKAYRDVQPRAMVRVVDCGVEWLADQIATGEADLALGPDRIVGPDVSCSPLASSPWVAWCSPEHPLAAKSVLTWSDFKDVECYAAGRDHEHMVLPQLAELPERPQIRIAQVVTNVSTALGFAAANLGVTFSPDYVKAVAEPLGLVMRRVVDPEIFRHISVYAPAARPLSAAAADFRAFLESRLGAAA